MLKGFGIKISTLWLIVHALAAVPVANAESLYGPRPKVIGKHMVCPDGRYLSIQRWGRPEISWLWPDNERKLSGNSYWNGTRFRLYKPKFDSQFLVYKSTYRDIAEEEIDKVIEVLMKKPINSPGTYNSTKIRWGGWPIRIDLENSEGKKMRYIFGDEYSEGKLFRRGGLRDNKGKWFVEYGFSDGWKAQNKFFCPPGEENILLRRVAPVRLASFSNTSLVGAGARAKLSERDYLDSPLMFFTLNLRLKVLKDPEFFFSPSTDSGGF